MELKGYQQKCIKQVREYLEALAVEDVKYRKAKEAYPELKADANFRDLQDKLSGVEDEIQMSRRYYNGAVRNLNTIIESFPSNIIANVFHFAKAEFFEIGDPAQRETPKVDFKTR